jgi:hypothetical protein
VTVAQLIALLQQAPNQDREVWADFTTVTDDPNKALGAILGLHIDARDTDVVLVTNEMAVIHIN